VIPTDQINQLLRHAVDNILGVPGFAIQTRQDAPRPAGPYCAVGVLADVGVGWEQITYQDLGGGVNNEKLEGVREFTFSLGFYRDGSNLAARTVRLGLVRETVRETFRAAGLGLGVRSEVRNISLMRENGNEQIAQFDVTFNLVDVDTGQAGNEVGQILTAPVTNDTV